MFQESFEKEKDEKKMLAFCFSLLKRARRISTPVKLNKKKIYKMLKCKITRHLLPPNTYKCDYIQSKEQIAKLSLLHIMSPGILAVKMTG